MKEKTSLFELKIIEGKISNSLAIDKYYIKNNIILNYSYEFNQNPSEESYLKNYYNLTDDENIFRISKYLSDLHNLYHDLTLVPVNMAGLVLFKGDKISTHNHVDPYDLETSPDMSCIYTVDCGDNPSYVVFEYDKGRIKNSTHKVLLQKNKYILFNSSINHYYTTNLNEQPLLNLSFKFQIK